MNRQRTAIVGIVCGVAWLIGNTSPVAANTPLTQADIQELRNQVEFIPDGASARPARLSDRLVPGDALSTFQDAFAQLRFNDGTLARLGELALFQFQPETRTFDLDNGTLLLLIPPDRGRSRLRTPNATAGIRGSALFIRYIEGSNPDNSITIIGALTSSGIEVTNENNGPLISIDDEANDADLDETQGATVELEAGYMAVVVGDRPPQLFTFDLDIFYQTSPLTRGLALAGGNDVGDGAIALVQEETRDGLAAQTGTLTRPYVDNPFFVYRPWITGANFGEEEQSPLNPDEAFDEDVYGDDLDDILEAVDILTPEDALDGPLDMDDDIFDVPDEAITEPPMEPLPDLDIEEPFIPDTPIMDEPDPDIPDVVEPPDMDDPEPIDEPPDVIEPPMGPEPPPMEPGDDPDFDGPDPDDDMGPDPDDDMDDFDDDMGDRDDDMDDFDDDDMGPDPDDDDMDDPDDDFDDDDMDDMDDPDDDFDDDMDDPDDDMDDPDDDDMPNDDGRTPIEGE